MKWVYLLGLLLLAVAWVQAEEESDGLQDITKTGDDDSDKEDALKEAIRQLFEKKCEQAGGKELVAKITHAVDTAKSCFSEHLPKTAEELKDSSSSEEQCSDKRVKFRKCFAEFIDALKECADPEEKYLPEFIFDAVDAVQDYLCADDGAIVLKIFEDKTLECVFHLAEKDNFTEPCYDKLKVLRDDTPKDLIITKAELCEDLTTAKTCYGDIIKQECPDETNLREIVVGIYNAISSPCKKDAMNPLNLRLPSTRK